MPIKSEITVLKKTPFRWCFDIFLKDDRSKKLCKTRFIQVETKEEALEIARRFSWIKEVEDSQPPMELSYSLLPYYGEWEGNHLDIPL